MLKRRLCNCKGVSIVEFAIVFPLLLAFLGGTVDFGMVFFASHIAQNAAREGARFAVIQEGLPEGLFSLPQVNERIENAIPEIVLFQGYTHTTALVLATCQVTVTVTGTSPYFFLPAVFAALNQGATSGTAFAIERTVAMRYERNTCAS